MWRVGPLRSRPIIHVAAALIWRDESLLISRRTKGSHLEGFWEFPGGKLEDGEDLRMCVEREVMEELGIKVRAGGLIFETRYEYEEKSVDLSFFNCTMLEGEAFPREKQEIRWVLTSDLGKYRFPPPDLKMIEVVLLGNSPL